MDERQEEEDARIDFGRNLITKTVKRKRRDSVPHTLR